MQENNMSVFGTVIRNEEIADFMRLLNLAREIFKQELTVVEIMPGGLTNKNFRAVTEDGTQIAIRLAGQGTANYINRPGEKHNAGEIAGLGIAPEIYYHHAPRGLSDPGRGTGQGGSGHAPLSRQRPGVQDLL